MPVRCALLSDKVNALTDNKYSMIRSVCTQIITIQ